jgi:hypothetical protein
MGVALIGKRFKVPCTTAQQQEFATPRYIAKHEAAHAVAAWMLGVPIHYMQLNDDPNDKENYAGELDGVTVTGIPLPEMVASSIGERWVFGLQSAFITLAGVIGGGDCDRMMTNTINNFECKLHVGEAKAIFQQIAGATRAETVEQVGRLIRVVDDAFMDEAIRYTTGRLAEELLKCRRLEGDQIVSLLADCYPVFVDTVAKRAAAHVAD